ncbi:MAG: hypothetical protein IKP37_15165 [Paludibacteraceae bacterium]|nr:hypothetical protein [Paludibacteraceae bacterium]
MVKLIIKGIDGSKCKVFWKDVKTKCKDSFYDVQECFQIDSSLSSSKSLLEGLDISNIDKLKDTDILLLCVQKPFDGIAIKGENIAFEKIHLVAFIIEEPDQKSCDLKSRLLKCDFKKVFPNALIIGFTEYRYVFEFLNDSNGPVFLGGNREMDFLNQIVLPRFAKVVENQFTFISLPKEDNPLVVYDLENYEPIKNSIRNVTEKTSNNYNDKNYTSKLLYRVGGDLKTNLHFHQDEYISQNSYGIGHQNDGITLRSGSIVVNLLQNVRPGDIMRAVDLKKEGRARLVTKVEQIGKEVYIYTIEPLSDKSVRKIFAISQTGNTYEITYSIDNNGVCSPGGVCEYLRSVITDIVTGDNHDICFMQESFNTCIYCSSDVVEKNQLERLKKESSKDGFDHIIDDNILYYFRRPIFLHLITVAHLSGLEPLTYLQRNENYYSQLDYFYIFKDVLRESELSFEDDYLYEMIYYAYIHAVYDNYNDRFKGVLYTILGYFKDSLSFLSNEIIEKTSGIIEKNKLNKDDYKKALREWAENKIMKEISGSNYEDVWKKYRDRGDITYEAVAFRLLLRHNYPNQVFEVPDNLISSETWTNVFLISISLLSAPITASIGETALIAGVICGTRTAVIDILNVINENKGKDISDEELIKIVCSISIDTLMSCLTASLAPLEDALGLKGLKKKLADISVESIAGFYSNIVQFCTAYIRGENPNLGDLSINNAITFVNVLLKAIGVKDGTKEMTNFALNTGAQVLSFINSPKSCSDDDFNLKLHLCYLKYVEMNNQRKNIMFIKQEDNNKGKYELETGFEASTRFTSRYSSSDEKERKMAKNIVECLNHVIEVGGIIKEDLIYVPK